MAILKKIGRRYVRWKTKAGRKEQYMDYYNRKIGEGVLKREILTYSDWVKMRKGRTVRTKTAQGQLSRNLSEKDIANLRSK